jgi:hypothetical protein
MTPDQYLAQAKSLQATGNNQLAQQFINLYRMRTGHWPDSPSIVPSLPQP